MSSFETEYRKNNLLALREKAQKLESERCLSDRHISNSEFRYVQEQQIIFGAKTLNETLDILIRDKRLSYCNRMKQYDVIPF